jgi:hypothetical protein
MLMALVALSLAGVAGPARAYYDDVHFALTYYIARQVGYTPEQAYRIANADVSVDYSYQTEPVQAGSLYAAFRSIAAMPETQEPRWRFHAFRNENVFPDAVGDAPQAAEADRGINTQQVVLWQRAIADRNPGVFLHFLQDKLPHARYGSAYGHWDIVFEKRFALAEQHGLKMGGTTDWLGYREHAKEPNLTMVQTTFEVLASYMKKISPGQAPNAFDPSAFTDVLQALRDANPYPPALQGKVLEVLKSQKGATGAGFSEDVINRLASGGNFFLPSTDPDTGLTPSETAEVLKHLRGPDLTAAVTVVDAEIARRRWPLAGDWAAGSTSWETVPPVPTAAARYRFDLAGRLETPGQADDYVLTGTLKLSVRRAGTADSAGGSAQVSVRLATTLSDSQGIPLGDPRTAVINGDALSLDNLPIGDLIVEVAGAGSTAVSEKVLMRKPVETYFIDLPTAAEPAATSTLPAELDSADTRLNELLAQLRAQRDQAVQRFEATLAAVRTQLAQRQAAGAGTPSAPTDAQDVAALCARIDAADLSLTATLAQIAAEQEEVETALQQARQRASRCADAADANAADGALQQARGVADEIDRQATALALLAVQVQDLEAQRRQRKAQRSATGGAASAAGAAVAAVDFADAEAAWAELQRFDRAWSNGEAERERQELAQFASAIDAEPEPRQPTLRADLARLHALIDEIAQLGLEARDLQQRAGQLAALRVSAAAAPPPVAGADDRWLDAADPGACLGRPPIDIARGMEQANTSGLLARLALDKLGTDVEASLRACRSRLATPLDPAAAVAAKHCRYEGSEAYWDEAQQRPMCRCPTGRRWNADRSACVDDRDAQLAATDCSRYPNTEPTWSEAKQKAVCTCIAGTQVVAGQQACEPDQATRLAQQSCTVAHSEPYWNEQEQRPGCRCEDGYVYDEIFKECEIDRDAQVRAADCTAYDHAEAYWDADAGRAACRCVEGYKSDPVAHTCTADVAALLAAADCSRWPGSEPLWDQYAQKVNCECVSGTRYDERAQRCERDIDALLADTDCSRWPGSEPFWDQYKQEVRCECVRGTRYNDYAKRCERELSPAERVAALDCSIYPNTEAYWDAGQEQPMCRCRQGFEQDLYGGGCVAEPVVIACDTASKSGANPPETITVEIGSAGGIAQFHYDMHTVPDRMVVEYGGQVVADTGCVGGSSNIPVELSGYAGQVIIHVTPNCRGDDDTVWNFTLNCPQ